MEVLSDTECQNALTWMPDGKSFAVLNVKEVERVLSSYFKETKYSSFVSAFSHPVIVLLFEPLG